MAEEAIKQAIREVLLSKEFLEAFAWALGNAPLSHTEPRFFVCEPQDVAEEVKHYSNEVKKYER